MNRLHAYIERENRKELNRTRQIQFQQETIEQLNEDLNKQRKQLKESNDRLLNMQRRKGFASQNSGQMDMSDLIEKVYNKLNQGVKEEYMRKIKEIPQPGALSKNILPSPVTYSSEKPPPEPISQLLKTSSDALKKYSQSDKKVLDQ